MTNSVKIKSGMSAYWKCQLIGWGLFTIVTYTALVVGYPNGTGFLGRAIVTCSFGLLFTHAIRWVIKKLKVLKRKLSLQIIYLLLITLAVTFIANLIYVTVLHYTGILEENKIIGFQGGSLVRTFIYLYYQELMVAFGWVSIYFLVQYIRNIKIVEREIATIRIQLLESEAQALRSQMNPHFIFNSMNSIKALINKNENEKAANYLTTFSKLIRTLFQNSDKREISLSEELETCKLYTELEKLRFGDKIKFVFEIDKNIDLKDIKVPALTLQPFIENAIWHGLIPKESGGSINVEIKNSNGSVQCIVDDDGIGRDQSKNYKPQYENTYQSKGIGLTQSRFELNKLLNDREDAIQIVDKKNESGKSTGTRIIISFFKDNIN